MSYNGRLTSLSHGGGCGCKIAPGILSDILKASPIRNLPTALIVGLDNNEDAAVYQINENQAIVATTDFFMPIVDDPYEFGRIAATKKITSGGESVCADAGIMIAGGHSIDTVEPIYGLVAIGIVDPKKLKRNNGAKEGDSIILSKPLGVGILSAGLKKINSPMLVIEK
jgi:selenide, water dikinase